MKPDKPLPKQVFCKYCHKLMKFVEFDEGCPVYDCDRCDIRIFFMSW